MDNTVTIDNSTVNENVYGGYTESDGAISEKIQNNKVIFKNAAKIKGMFTVVMMIRVKLIL